VKAKQKALCRRLANSLHASVGCPTGAAAVLAALLLKGTGTSLFDAACIAGSTPGQTRSGMSYLISRGAAAHQRRTRASAKRKPVRRLKRQLLGLREAYSTGGVRAIRETHTRYVESAGHYRALTKMVERFCPLERVLDTGVALDERVRLDGLPFASCDLLSRLPDAWEIHLPPTGRAELRDAPLVVFGNHPSMLTPFLLAAALEREDMRILAHRYVVTLMPAMAPYILPIEPTYGIGVGEKARTGAAHALTLSALGWLERRPSAEEARETNRRSLEQAALHVRDGGAVVIFPDGGRDGGPWFPGLGRLMAGLSDSDARLVPACESSCTNRRIYEVLKGRRGSTQASRPIRLDVGEPVPLRRLGLPEDASEDERVGLARTLFEAWRPT
jgi:hypothetical protein